MCPKASSFQTPVVEARARCGNRKIAWLDMSRIRQEVRVDRHGAAIAIFHDVP